jgi:hypothetical protein
MNIVEATGRLQDVTQIPSLQLIEETAGHGYADVRVAVPQVFVARVNIATVLSSTEDRLRELLPQYFHAENSAFDQRLHAAILLKLKPQLEAKYRAFFRTISERGRLDSMGLSRETDPKFMSRTAYRHGEEIVRGMQIFSLQDEEAMKLAKSLE